jgi:hypothetical protein
MKKALFVLVLMIATLVANAQATGTTDTKTKSTSTVKSTSTTVTNKKSTRTAVKVGELQKAITDNVAKDYAGFTIKDATSVTLNSTVTYDVVVVKGTTTETLVYDKDGKFIKKMAHKAPMKRAPKKKK